MSLTVTLGPENTDLTTADRVTDELDIEPTLLINRLIAEASEAINRELGRGRDGLAEQTYEEELGAHGDPYMTVSRTPVTDVDSVTRDGQTVTDVEIHDAEAGLLYREGGFRSTEAASTHLGPAIRQPYEAHPSYTVTYTAGYVMPGGDEDQTLPREIERAAIETVKAWHHARKRDPAVTAESVGDVSVRYAGDRSGGSGDGSLPPRALQLLAPHRRVA